MKFSRPYVKKVVEGSVPPISQTQAWRMRMRDFDPVDNMATFDWSERAPFEGKRWTDTVFLIRCLGSCSGPNALEGLPGWRAAEGVAGSASLAVLASVLSRNRSGMARGRWKKRWNEAEVPTDVNDVDFFVGGKNGRSAHRFRVFVADMINKVREYGAKHGKVVTVEKEIAHHYANFDGVVLIQNVRLSGVGVKLSFVQAPACDTMLEVVESFDIDVVKVILNVQRMQLHSKVEVAVAVESGNASVCDYGLQKNYPCQFDLSQVGNTLCRMRKYGKRGYLFKAYPVLKMKDRSGRISK